MRTLLYIFIFVCAVLAAAWSQPTLYMSPETQQVAVGAEFDVTIKLDDLPGGAAPDVMKTFSITVGFDPAVLKVISLAEGSFMNVFGSTWSWSTFDNAAGTAQFDNALLATPFAFGSGNLFTIRFRALSKGTVNLAFNDKDLRDGDNFPLVFSAQTGTIFSGDAHLFVDPNHTVLGGPGDECTIAIKIRNGFNIRGIKIIIMFDAALVEVVSVTNGTFMRPSGYNTFASHAIRSEEVEYNESIISPANVGAHGAGTMFFITFRALADGTSPVAFKTVGGDYEKTQLTDVNNQYLNYTTEDGDIRITPICIELSAFTATRSSENVLIEWQIANELDAAGYYVSSAGANGTYTRLHETMILARKDGSQGADYEFIDTRVVSGDITYKLEQVCCDGTSRYYGPISITQTSDVNSEKNPSDHAMVSNYPNPFNPTTTIQYALANQSNVRIEIINAQGIVINTLCDTQQVAGHHCITWNGVDDMGRLVGSGVYFYRFNTEQQTAVGRMLLMR